MTDSYTNLNAHFSTNTKATLPDKTVAIPPEKIPIYHVFNDKDANHRLAILNKDIYQDSKKEKRQDGITFVKWFGSFVIALLAFLGIKSFFK